jgi:hypothetical protein
VTWDELSRAKDAAADATPAFKRAAQSNFLVRVFFDAIVNECATGPTGELLPASKVQRALQNAARGAGRGRWSRRLLKKNDRTPMAKAVGAIVVPRGTAGRRPISEARIELDEFLDDLSDDAWTLFTMPGRQGSRSLTLSDAAVSARIMKLAAHYEVTEQEMLTAVNKSRAWLATKFGSGALDNVRRRKHRDVL